PEDTANSPAVTKKYLLLNIADDGYMSLMEGGGTREDLKVPDTEVGERIRTLYDEGKEVEITVTATRLEENVTDAKESTE
ncbi:hypothetical protein ACWD1Z_36670, partial [Streptomyces sp. NPDC002784]